MTGMIPMQKTGDITLRCMCNGRAGKINVESGGMFFLDDIKRGPIDLPSSIHDWAMTLAVTMIPVSWDPPSPPRDTNLTLSAVNPPENITVFGFLNPTFLKI